MKLHLPERTQLWSEFWTKIKIVPHFKISVSTIRSRIVFFRDSFGFTLRAKSDHEAEAIPSRKNAIVVRNHGQNLKLYLILRFLSPQYGPELCFFRDSFGLTPRAKSIHEAAPSRKNAIVVRIMDRFLYRNCTKLYHILRFLSPQYVRSIIAFFRDSFGFTQRAKSIFKAAPSRKNAIVVRIMDRI